MTKNVKALEKHLEIVCQINLKMESLQVKIEELDKWRNTEKKFPSSLPAVKSYDIRFHTLAMNECQELASKFEEKARQSLVGMMDMIWEINLWCSKISSMIRDQFQTWTSNFFFFFLRSRRQIWNDQGRGSGDKSYIQGWHSRIFSQVVDGVFTLHNFCTQVCGWHGEI